MSGVRSVSPQYGLGELFSRLIRDVLVLLRGEIQLARVELDQKLRRIIMAAVWLVGGALVAFAGLVVILQGIAAALALVLPTWAASLIVGFAIVGTGGLFAWSGLGMLSLKTLTPDRTVASLQKDAHLVREHT